jgi:hypothetical protein
MEDLNDRSVIKEKIASGKHLGTSFIKGIPCVLKTKTFNLYLQDDGTYLVTNHYGDDLINARVYSDVDELKTSFPGGLDEFHYYRLPLLP